MATILDILGATLIGGMLLILALNLMDTTNQFFFGQNDDLVVQQDLTSMTNTLEYDLRKMGFAVSEGDTVVLQADSTHLKFLGDCNGNWVPDTTYYYLGPTSELTNTANPNDRFLYRKINSLPAQGLKVGVVTIFYFNFLNQDGILVDVSNPVNFIGIKMIRITLQVESPFVYGINPNPQTYEYRRAFWQQTRLVSRNLRR
jgi:hypothetical protein